MNKVESQIPKSVQSNKQSLIGLHKKVMSLSALPTRSRDAQQINVSSTGQRFFYSVPNGVLNLLTGFISRVSAPLRWAARKGYIPMVQYLREQGANK